MSRLVKVDERDLKILRYLLEDASESTSTIARELDIPRTTVQERIRKMRDAGVIRKFTVLLDYRLLDRSVCAFVLVSFMPGTGYSQKDVAEQIGKIAGVEEVHLIAGEWDILLKVRASSIEDIGKLIIERIRSIPGVAKTLTCTVFQSVKEAPSI
jgi:Lrp/AsnC family leucine-responsive transcriptional regulator